VRQSQIVQASAWYPPTHSGGTETYVESLVAELSGLGIESTVLVPRQAGVGEAYVHRSIPVETYAVNATPTPGELKRSEPHQDFEQFKRRLTSHRGAVYHQHAWTRGCGPLHLKAARELGMHTVLTVHVPGVTCLRGTMLRFGAAPCDGRVESAPCGACWAHERGMPRAAAQAIGRLPIAVARCAQRFEGRLATALSARELGAGMIRRTAEMISNADRIVAVCQWLYDALALNGTAAEKLVLCRQGVSAEVVAALSELRPLRRRTDGGLRLLLLARLEPVKGVDVAVRAVRALPEDPPAELRICALPAAEGTRAYEDQVRHLAGADPRIRIEGPVPRSGLAEAFAGADVLLAPSIWLETGPLVVLEAQAAGLFVLGSQRGGIEELVRDDDCGELVEAGDVAAWTAAIARLATRHRAEGLPRLTRPVRTMATVAAEMAALYRTL